MQNTQFVNTKPILVGHRGWPAAYPENTLAGFRAALEQGALAVECDIQFSSDGMPVVIHDPDLKRTAGKAGQVAAYTVAELCEISVHEPDRFGENMFVAPVTTLHQLVALMQEFPAAKVFVEIKEEAFVHFSRRHCVDKVMAAIEPLGKQAIVISFDAEVLPLARNAGAAIGWVLKHYNTKAQLQAAALAPEFLICNYKKIPAAPAELWPGNWQWFLYDIVDWHLALLFAERGVVYIETWDIGAMLAAKPNLIVDENA